MKPRGLLAGTLAAFLTTVALFALTGYQITTATAGTRLLSRLAAAMVEIDRWLPAHAEDLQLLARDRPESVIHVDLPVLVNLPARPLVDADDGAVRSMVLSAMGTELYRQGNDAFVNDEGASSAPPIDQPVHWAVSLLSSPAHNLWRLVLPISLVLLAAACIATMLTERALAPSVAIGAGFGGATSFAAWLIAGVAGSSFTSPVDKEVMLILRDGAWLGLRDCLAVLAAAVVLGMLFGALNRQRLRFRGGVPRSIIYPPNLPDI